MKKNKAEVFFNPIEGSAPLSISWYHGPKGDAVEAKNKIGVGFFAHNGDLLSVLFDDVGEKKDHQILEFDRYRVEVMVSHGEIHFKLHDKLHPQKSAAAKKAI